MTHIEKTYARACFVLALLIAGTQAVGQNLYLSMWMDESPVVGVVFEKEVQVTKKDFAGIFVGAGLDLTNTIGTVNGSDYNLNMAPRYKLGFQVRKGITNYLSVTFAPAWMNAVGKPFGYNTPFSLYIQGGSPQDWFAFRAGVSYFKGAAIPSCQFNFRLL